MSSSTLYFALPIGWTLLLIVLGAFFNKLVYSATMVRFYPPEGFPEEGEGRSAALVRFLRTDPKIQRQTWQAQARPWFLFAWITGTPLLIVAVRNPSIAFGGLLAVLGLSAFIVARRRKIMPAGPFGPLVRPGLHFDLRNQRKFYCVMFDKVM